MANFSRRSFLHSSGTLLAGLSLPLPITALAKTSSAAPSDKIRMGLIGCNSMGWYNLREHLALPEVDAVALCDVDEQVLQKRAQELQKITGKKPALFTDFRKLLEQKDIDAVIIGTPDHWHCLNAVYACEAGKDVYVEKPLANSIAECNLIAAAAKRYNRVVQVGQWQRSGPHWQSALDYVKSGKLGKISLVKNWLYYPNFSQPKQVANTPPPAGVDYDFWLGPARTQAFNTNRFHGTWRYFWDYGGGIMSDWGVHLLDIAFKGMGTAVPKSVYSTGGKYAHPNSAMQTPDNQFAIFEFDDFAVTWEHGVGATPGLYGNNYCGVAFVGSNGTLVADRDKWRLLPEAANGKYILEALPEQRGSGKDLAFHVQNFVQCIKSRAQPICNAEEARDIAVQTHVANISLKTGRKLRWDHAANSFHDKEADAYITPTYRAPWKLPAI